MYNMLTYVGKQCIIVSICLITTVTIRPGVYIHKFDYNTHHLNGPIHANVSCPIQCAYSVFPSTS